MVYPKVLFFVIALFGAWYFLYKLRHVDFFTIGFASALLYFLPGFFGFVRSSRDFSATEPLLPETYLVFVCVLTATLIGAMLFDQLVPARSGRINRDVSLALTTETAVAIALFAVAATLMTAGDALFSPQKSVVMESIGRWHLLYRFSAIFLVVFAVIRRQIHWCIAGFGILLFDLYVGYRSGLIFAVIATAVVLLHKQMPTKSLAKRPAVVAVGVLTVLLFVLFKQVYVAVKLGLWVTVIERTSSADAVILALVNSEPFTTQSILNEVLRTEFYTGPAHLIGVLNLFVPFATALGAEAQSYNDLFQNQLFAGVVSGGMAHNFWAQLYSIGGWFGLALGIPIFVLLLGLGSWWLQHCRGSMLALVSVVFTVIAFYVHRNDIGFLLTLVRRCVLVWAILVIPGMLVVDAVKLAPGRLRNAGARLDPTV